MKIVNVALLKNPLNWFIIILMILIAGIAGHLVLSWLGIEPKTAT